MASLEDLQALHQRLAANGDKQAQLFFILKQPRNVQAPYSVRKTVNSHEISNALISLFEHNLSDIIKSESALVNYDINLDTNECLQYIPCDDVPYANLINQGIFQEETLEVLSSLEEGLLKKLWAYAVKISFGDEAIVYYKKYSPGKVLKKGLFNALLFRDGRFSELEDDVFQIHNDFDAILMNQEIIILKAIHFERIFGYEELYEHAAQTALVELAATHNYVDTDLLTTLVSTDGRKKRKLTAILNNQLITEMGYDHIKQTIQRYTLEIEIDDANQKFVLNAKNAYIFLKALNDDYLRSEATHNRYEATSKRRK
jgi:hypothetical protein